MSISRIELLLRFYFTKIDFSLVSVGIFFFINLSLMSELLSVANEMVQSREAESVDGETVHQERYEIALRLLTQLASSPFRRLLVPYFTRVLIFQCGMRAKLVSGGILSSRMSTAARSDLQDLHPIEQVLNQFKFMAGKYQALVTSALGTALSPAALQEITSRISATIDRCGVTQIANDLIELVQQHAHLRHALFAGFLRADDRFDEKSLKLRKILSYLFKTASRREAARFQELFEGTLLVAELREIDFTPRFDQQRVLCADWALQLVSSVVRLYETAQSVARLELLNIPQCHFAAERALCREFQQLSSGQVDVFAKALAIALSSLLDCSQLQDRPPAWKEATLKSVLGVQKVRRNCLFQLLLFVFHFSSYF